MNDKKASDDEFFEDNFEEEFDFGEENFEIPTKGGGGSSKKGPGKPVFILVILVILGTIGYFGYQFYGSEKDKIPSLISKVGNQLGEKFENKQKEEAERKAKQLALEEQERKAKQLALEEQEKKELEAKLAQVKEAKEKAAKEEALKTAATTTIAVTPPVQTPAPVTNPPTPVATTASTTPATETTPSNLPSVSTPSLPALATTVPLPSALSPAKLEKIIEGQKQEQPGAPVAAAAEKNLSLQDMQKDLLEKETPSTPTAGTLNQGPEGAALAQGLIPQAVPITPTPTPPPAPAIPNVVPPSVPPLPTTGVTPPPSMAESQQLKEMKNQIKEAMDSLTRVNQQMENNLSQIKDLDAYTREVSHTVSKLNTDISAMDNRVLALTKTTNSLSKEIGTVQGEVGAINKAERVQEQRSIRRAAPIEELEVSTAARRAPSIMLEEPEYVVHAVIPGRAWLKSCKGQILTVTEGDSLGNYGKILVIDAASGVVLTSSGITFR